MTDVEAVPTTVVSLAAWSIHLEFVDHPRPWRLDAFAAVPASPTAAVAVAVPAYERAEFHLTDADVAVLAATLLRPPRPQDRPPGRARLLREGTALRLRLYISAIDGDQPEPRGVINLQEHHRQVLLDDIARHRLDLIPTVDVPEPRLHLDPMPVTGLGIDQVAQLRDRCNRWLDSEGIRAALADREIARHIATRTTGP
ncbi:hypothetical protein B4N89_02275 [Embleya scabrispora]|uniref:Uncharacterized protein n=1 Tax=Embleya scabrispora TaxID=159449 RepID=A0A1T3NT48_9ACTN|nr:hypothetical protein [Embleya scabrispora]OPC79925.1 hypothetical protein B4N89_02275 [Embleya scabrispora]